MKSQFANPPIFTSTTNPGASFELSFVIARSFLVFPMLIVAASILQPWTDPAWLYLDTLEAVRRSGDCCHVYQGLLSNLGILLWVATSAICAFAAFILTAINRSSGHPTILLFSGGVLSGLLALDDLFQLHEKVFPFFGAPELVTLCVYGTVLALLTYSASFVPRAFDWPLFGLSIGLFISSVLIDQVFHDSASIRIVIEDGAKFIGIASWFSCLVSVAFRLLLELGNGRSDRVRIS